MGRGDLGNPLNTYQTYQGEAEEQVRELCARLAEEEVGLRVADSVYEEPIKAYLEKVKLHQPRPAVRAEQMTLWIARFEELVRSGRAGEVPSTREVMYASFGNFEPIDPALHELLSRTLLLENKRYDAAIVEVDYALQIVGNDIELLHRKALALVEIQDLPAAEAIVDELLLSNAHLRTNPELASLEGRIHRERWQLTDERSHLDKAFAAYMRAYEADQTQYYPGVNAGSLALAGGDEEKSEELFRDVLARCHDLQERSPVSYWVDFSAGEAHLGLGDTEEATEDYLHGLKRVPAPPTRDRLSALKGARRMARAKGFGNDVVASIERVLG